MLHRIYAQRSRIAMPDCVMMRENFRGCKVPDLCMAPFVSESLRQYLSKWLPAGANAVQIQRAMSGVGVDVLMPGRRARHANGKSASRFSSCAQTPNRTLCQKTDEKKQTLTHHCTLEHANATSSCANATGGPVIFAAGNPSSLAPVQSAGDLSQASGSVLDDGPITQPLTERAPEISVVRPCLKCLHFSSFFVFSASMMAPSRSRSPSAL